ncbi:MAG: DUF4783 domain-containing protein [Bacteroidia bacterium]|nr:DUF4783 domain-containing protein [Bacteroidia bacterium]
MQNIYQMMKTLLFAAIALISLNANASESTRIANAIQSANTNELVQMFNSSIELVTPASSGVNTKEQAKIVLDNFFKNHPPIKATVTHETNGTTNSMIVISLITKNGTFRISVSGTYKAGTFLINEFKIS